MQKSYCNSGGNVIYHTSGVLEDDQSTALSMAANHAARPYLSSCVRGGPTTLKKTMEGSLNEANAKKE